jgi:hypothetical protein
MNKSRGILFINCTNTYFVYSKILGAVLGDWNAAVNIVDILVEGDRQ